MSGKTDGQTFSPALWPPLSEYLTSQMGLSFDPQKWHEFHPKITAAMADFGFDNLQNFTDWLLSAPPTQKQVEILAAHLTIGETYFFREKKAFEFLERSVLPHLMESRQKTGKRLRFWSAGSSSGEEAYSIAMVLDKMIPDRKDWDIVILATDINPLSLRKAAQGLYSPWSFREISAGIKDKYFTRIGGNAYAIVPDIRNMVTFSYLNLVTDTYPSLQNSTAAVDVIFCRNVLMYFSPEHIRKTVNRLYRSLAENGWLIVSPVETSNVYYTPFEAVRTEEATFYKKENRKMAPAKTVVPSSGDKKETAPPRSLPSANRRRLSGRKSGSAQPTTPAKPSGAAPSGNETPLARRGAPKAQDRRTDGISDAQSNPDTLVSFAKALANQGNLEEALAICNRALSMDKCNSRLHYLAAVIYDEQKKGEEAKTALRKAIYLEPNFVLANFALANLCLKLGNPQEARKHFANTAKILSNCQPQEIIPESDGMTATRLQEILDAVCFQEAS